MSSSTALKPYKRALQAGTVTYGQVTSTMRVPPSLLIAGGQRCGTTSMYRALAQHPAIFKPLLHKGVHYFDMHYGKGMAWYTGHFVSRRKHEAVRRALGTSAVSFESSPYYMCHPLAAQRIANDLPGVKLLVLLRDPVERAYSAHAHELGRGFETVGFEEALELEEARLSGEDERITGDPAYTSHSHQHHAYVSRGQYVDHLRHLEAAVGRDRIHVVDSHEFFTEPETTFGEVLRFLGLPDHPGIAFERHNARSRSPLPDSVRSRLDDHFRPYDEQLAAWWGRTPSWRR